MEFLLFEQNQFWYISKFPLKGVQLFLSVNMFAHNMQLQVKTEGISWNTIEVEGCKSPLNTIKLGWLMWSLEGVTSSDVSGFFRKGINNARDIG